MIALAPYYLLIPFGLFMAGFVFFSFANIMSLARYGARNMIGLTATFLYVAGTAVLLFFAWQALAPIDWVTKVPLFSTSAVGF